MTVHVRATDAMHRARTDRADEDAIIVAGLRTTGLSRSDGEVIAVRRPGDPSTPANPSPMLVGWPPSASITTTLTVWSSTSDSKAMRVPSGEKAAS